MSGAARQIDQLRRHRVKPPRELSIAWTVQSTADDAVRFHKKMGQLIELWQAILPPEIAAQTSFGSFKGGTLHVIAESSSVAFELDRLLRADALSDLRRQFRGTLINVKIRTRPASSRDAARRVKENRDGHG